MKEFAKENQVDLPDWCRVATESEDKDTSGGEDIEFTPIDEMVGMFLHKDFGGTVFGGTVVSTDTCKDTKKKMYVLYVYFFLPTNALTLTPAQP